MKNTSDNYFIALTGAKKNVGDFLITRRAIALLEYVAPDFEYVLYPHWEELDDFDFVNKSQGIIILGGPGFQEKMYPELYKLRKDINEIKVPIYTLGSGWYGKPGDKVTEKLYHFTNNSRLLLKKINSTNAGISCRDYQTERVLIRNGFHNVTMTGCPVWYDINSIGKEFKPPSGIQKIVYTPAQHLRYSDQSIEVLKFIKSKYPKAQIIVSFHRGLGETDKYTSKVDAENTRKIADFALENGMKVVDVSYDDKKINFYDDCDFHIGYRVHAHIYFLSKRLPSILLHEDGRGNGVSEALNSPGINAYRTSKKSHLFKLMPKNYYISKLYSKVGVNLNNNITLELKRKIDKIENSNFECYKDIANYIDKHYSVMESFIKSMVYPNGDKKS